MSRSRKKNPVTWNASRSNKQSKQQCNKRFRRLVNQRIYSEFYLPQHIREVMDEWSMQGDGKHRWTQNMENYEKILRK